MAQLHYGDQYAARTQVADVDQEEGYGVPVHHKRTDPLTSDKDVSADVPSGYGGAGSFEQDGAGIQAPSPAGYGKLDEAKLGEDEGRLFSAATGDNEDGEAAGGQLPYEESAPPKYESMPREEGYTALGIEDSQDEKNSDNSVGMPGTEEGSGINQSQRASDQESMAKELEDHPATIEGSTINEKKGNADFSEREKDDPSRDREAAMAAEQQPEGDSGAAGGGMIDVQSLQRNYIDISEGNTDLKVNGLPEEDDQLKQPIADSGTGCGMIDVQSLQKNYVDLSEGNMDDLKVDDPDEEERQQHAQTSELTSQIHSNEDHPKQGFAVDNAAVLTEQERVCGADDDDDIHGCESFQGEDGREKIKAEGYNIYTGEPENAVYDAEEVLGDHHDQGATDQPETEAAKQDANGYGGTDNEQARGLDEQAFTEQISAPIEQDAGLKLDSSEDGKLDGGIDNEAERSLAGHERLASLPHPQDGDLKESMADSRDISNEDDGKQMMKDHDEPHKKGVFEKIKEKLTTPFHSSS